MVSIVAVGTSTSLGGVCESAAAFRAGISRTADLINWPYFDEDTREELVVKGHPAAAVPIGFTGFARYAKLLAEALNDLGDACWVDKEGLESVTLIVPKADELGGISVDLRSEADRLKNTVSQLLHGRLPECPWNMINGDRVTTAEVIAQIQASDKPALLVCLDSCLDMQRILHLRACRRLKTIDEPVGVTPGEACCAIILAPGNVKSCLSIGAVVVSSAEGKSDSQRETTTDFQSSLDGRAIAALVQQALEGANAGDAAGAIFTDLNGESWRAQNWGKAICQLVGKSGIVNWDFRIPAACFGETGIASMMMSLTLASQAFSRGYLDAQHTIITATDDLSDRQAVLLLQG